MVYCQDFFKSNVLDFVLIKLYIVFELYIWLLYVNYVSLYVVYYLIDLDYQFIKYKLYCLGLVFVKYVKWKEN